VLVLNLLIML